MARGASITVENNFTRGLITESTAMNFPENAVTDADNTVFREDGSIVRRLGCDVENDYQAHPIAGLSSDPDAVTEFKWYSSGPQGTVQLLVQQLGERLHFFSISTGDSLSRGRKSFSVPLLDFASPGSSQAQIASRPCQYTTGRSRLVVVHPLCDPFYVSYDQESDSIETTRIIIKVRDFQTLETPFAIDERPTVDNNLHRYNMFNQGWYPVVKARPGNRQVYDFFRTEVGAYPARSEVWWMYRQTAAGDAENINIYRPGWESDKFARTTTAGANGHYVYPAFDVNRTAVSGIPGLPGESSGPARPSACAFYAGRVFYSGVSADGYSSRVYYSQIIEDDSKFGLCYQVNDPTSEQIPDLLDTDGGVVSLPLIERVVSMRVLGDQLVIIATNGIYTISGTVNTPFKATDYSTSYVSPLGAASHLSIVDLDGGIMWWGADGIYGIAPDERGVGIQNISKQTIQKFIEEVPTANIPFIKGAYNKRDNLVQWVFSDLPGLSGYRYNRILELNVTSGAFYPYTISDGPRISGISAIGGQREVVSFEDVLDLNGDLVETLLGEPVFVRESNFVPSSELFKYTIIGNFQGVESLTYGELRDLELLDWRSIDTTGISYDSYGVSGYRVRGEFLRKFQSTPIEFLVRNIEDGRILVSGIWDYGFRSTFKYELYLTRPEVSHIFRRIKLRGKGMSLQIRFESVSNAPFELIGWSSFDTGGTLP